MLLRSRALACGGLHQVASHFLKPVRALMPIPSMRRQARRVARPLLPRLDERMMDPCRACSRVPGTGIEVLNDDVCEPRRRRVVIDGQAPSASRQVQHRHHHVDMVRRRPPVLRLYRRPKPQHAAPVQHMRVPRILPRVYPVLSRSGVSGPSAYPGEPHLVYQERPAVVHLDCRRCLVRSVRQPHSDSGGYASAFPVRRLQVCVMNGQRALRKGHPRLA